MNDLQSALKVKVKVKVKLSLCLNWAPRHEDILGELRYISTHSKNFHYWPYQEWKKESPARSLYY